MFFGKREFKNKNYLYFHINSLFPRQFPGSQDGERCWCSLSLQIQESSKAVGHSHREKLDPVVCCCPWPKESLMPWCFVSWKMLVAYLLEGNVKAIFYHWTLVFYSIDIFFLLILISMIDSLEYFQVCMFPYQKAFTLKRAIYRVMCIVHAPGSSPSVTSIHQFPYLLPLWAIQGSCK